LLNGHRRRLFKTWGLDDALSGGANSAYASALSKKQKRPRSDGGDDGDESAGMDEQGEEKSWIVFMYFLRNEERCLLI
jgi:hypothetical protein